jgi:transcriptional regulator with XRE-family HTH domain
MKDTVGTILKQWRKQRRYSQLQLALELDVSSKHISFIETGKSIPSQPMILMIANFLNLPKREINQALNLAGYAPIYSELSVNDKNLKPVFDAIEQMIESHMPYPAIVLDQNWNVIKANLSAQALLVELGYAGEENLIEALIKDDPKHSKIINWYEVISLLLIRLRQEINLLGSPQILIALEKKLSTCLSGYSNSDVFNPSQAVITSKFKLSKGDHSFFSIMAQLGTVQDVAVSEYKVELMFPADEITKAFYSSSKS